MNALHPTDEQTAAFLAHPKSTGPVHMLNLLTFKTDATYKSGETMSGREAYARYAKAFGQMLADLNIDGVETMFGGNANSVLIGESGPDGTPKWDAVALVRYPDAATMFKTVSSEAYRSIHFHRQAGLEGQMLIACDGEGVF